MVTQHLGKALHGRVVAALTAICALTTATVAGPAAPASASPEPSVAMATEQALPTGRTLGAQDPRTLGPNCRYPLCGRVHNDTPYQIVMSQNYTDSGGCVGPYAVLAPGADSYLNPYKDTDCVGIHECNFRVDDSAVIQAGYFARISSLPWNQTVRCA